MKKLGKLFILTIMAVFCAASLSVNASAFFFAPMGFPSTISTGSICLIIGIAVVVIAVAVILIVKKRKASEKNDDNKEE